MRWEKLPLQQQGSNCINGPGKRWGHTCNSVKGGKFLYLFGGYGQDNCQTNLVHVFDSALQCWSLPAVKGIPPTPRDSHTCTTVGDNLFVFGGTDGMNPLKDLHILNTSTHTWISPTVRGEVPDAREGHSAALVGKRLFIFGGCGKSSITSNEVYYNDLYILNTETLAWKEAKTSGIPPSPRDSHTCASWNNKFIVIGGEDEHDYYLSDVHILDAETLAWKELSTTGHKLTPRAGHSTVAFGNKLFVFGGFTDAQNLYDDLYMLDIDTGVSTKVVTAGLGPSARFSVAGDCLDPQMGGVLVFLGGCNRTLEALDDMYYLHTGLASLRDERRLEKLSLRKQLKLKCQEQNLRIDSSAQPSGGYLQFDQMGKRAFNAKVTESFPHGYTIETIIDGKALRGILFSNKPFSPDMADLSNARKRASGDSGNPALTVDRNNKSKASRTEKQAVVNIQSKVEDDAATMAKNLASALSLPHKSPSVAPLNLNDVMISDAPNLDKESCTSAKDSASLSLKQDGSTRRAEVGKDPSI